MDASLPAQVALSVAPLWLWALPLVWHCPWACHAVASQGRLDALVRRVSRSSVIALRPRRATQSLTALALTALAVEVRQRPTAQVPRLCFPHAPCLRARELPPFIYLFVIF